MGMELFYGLGAAALGLVLAWAIFTNRGRSARNERIGDAAAKEQYRHPESYNPDKFRRGLEPEK